MKMNGIFHVVDPYVIVLLASLLVGLLFPQTFAPVANWTGLILGIIFFKSSLRMDLAEVKDVAKDWKMLLMTAGWMLVLLPFVTFEITRAIRPDLALPFMLLAAMPAAMTSPLVAALAGGRHALAFIITLVTSLLAPITIPFMVGLLVGQDVRVDVFGMMRTLAIAMFTPFVLAQFLKKPLAPYLPRVIPFFRPVSTVLLGLLIAGVVGKNATSILAGIWSGGILWTVVALFLLFAAFHFFGYACVWWRDVRDRMTIMICLTYMNFTLAIYLAGVYFPTADVLLPVVLSTLVWSLSLAAFSPIAKHVLAKESVAVPVPRKGSRR